MIIYMTARDWLSLLIGNLLSENIQTNTNSASVITDGKSSDIVAMKEGNQFFLIDLGMEYDIAGFRITPPGAHNTGMTKGFKFSVANDFELPLPTTTSEFAEKESEFTTLYTLTDGVLESEKNVLATAETLTRGRYVAVHRNTTWAYAAVAEIEVYAKVPQKLNTEELIALHDEADFNVTTGKAASNENTYTLTDGNTNTVWAGKTFDVIFENNVEVSYISLKNANGLSAVSVASDAVFSDIRNVYSNAEKGENITVSVSSGEIGALRIEAEETMSLGELEIFGTYYGKDVYVKNEAVDSACTAISSTADTAVKNAADNNFNTSWVSKGQGVGESTPEIVFDLGEAKAVTRIGVYPAPQYAEAHRNFAVIASADEAFTEPIVVATVGSDEYACPKGEFTYLDFNTDESYRYYKIQKINNADIDGCLSFLEVRLLSYTVATMASVTSTNPQNGAEDFTNIDNVYGSEVAVVFEGEMNAETLNPQNVVITAGGAVLDYTKYRTEGNTYYIDSSELESDIQYNVTVGVDVRNVMDRGLSSPYSFSFKTGRILKVSKIDGEVLTNVAKYKSGIYFNEDIAYDGTNAYAGLPYYVNKPAVLVDGEINAGICIPQIPSSTYPAYQFIIIDLENVNDIVGIGVKSRNATKEDTKNLIAVGFNKLESIPNSDETFEAALADSTELGKVGESVLGSEYIYPEVIGSYRYIALYRKRTASAVWGCFLNEIEVYAKLSTEVSDVVCTKVNGIYTLSSSVKNYSGETIKCALLAGVFDEGGNLINSVMTQAVTVDNMTSQDLSLELPSDSEAHEIRAVVVNDETMIPLSDGMISNEI